MFILAFHIVAIGIMLALVYPMAYGRGFRAGERKTRRLLSPESAESTDSAQDKDPLIN